MNEPAVERDDHPLLEILGERQRVVTTLRAVLSLLLAVSAATLMQFEAGIFTLAPPLIIIFFFHDESYLAGTSLMGGVLLGALAEVIVIKLFFGANFVFFIINICLVLAIAYWIGQAMRGRWAYPFMAIFCLISLASVMFSAIDSVELGLQTALFWSLESCVGVLCTWFVTKLVWPSPSARGITQTGTGIAQACAILLNETAERYAAGKPPAYLSSPLSLPFFKSQLDLIETQKRRLKNTDPPYAQIKRRLEHLRMIYVHIRLVARSLDARRCQAIAAPGRQSIARCMRHLSDRLVNPEGHLPGGNEQVDVIPARLAVLKSNMEAIGDELDLLSHSRKRSLPTSEFAASTVRFSGFNLQTDSLKQAIKLTLALLLAFLIHLVPQVPASGYLVISVVVVLIQPNTGRSQLRVRLWIIGVLLGSAYSMAGLGLVSMLPHFSILVLLMAFGYLIGGYFAAGPDNVSYAGLQFCIALSIILGLASLPVDTVVGAQDRTIGALLGFFIALAVAHLVWPEDPVRQLRNGIAASLRDAAGHLANLKQDPAASALSPDTLRHTLNSDICSNLELLHDASFLTFGGQRGGVDYDKVTHVSARLFAQLFTLQDMLSRHDDVAQRLDIVGPLETSQQAIVALFGEIASVIETGSVEQLPTIQNHLQALQAALPAEPEAPEDAEQQGEAAMTARYFGIQIVRDIVADLSLVTHELAIAPDNSAIPLVSATGMTTGA